MFRRFEDILNNPLDLNNPFVCKLVEYVNFDEKNGHVMCFLEDNENNKILGFFYGKFANLLRKKVIRLRLPFNITVVKGKVIDLNGNLVFEIYQAIFENNVLINASSISEYNFCPAASYLRNHVRIDGDLNSNLIFGILFHDYLGILFDDKRLLDLSLKDGEISKLVISSLKKSIYNNWELITAVNVDVSFIIQIFIHKFLSTEVEFVGKELDKLKNTGDNFKFQTEKMIRSKYFGLQGRIDRLLWNNSKNYYSLYETKTGKSSASSEELAKYQLISYSIILNEYYSNKMGELLLEYPRNRPRDRLKVIKFEEDLFYKIISLRNDIWAIKVGNRPENGPFMHCGRCWSKNECSFYCMRNLSDNHCEVCSKCKYNQILSTKEGFEEFRRINIYYDWFFYFLEQEQLENLKVRAEISLEPRIREKSGNCFADLKISNIIEGDSIKNKQISQNSDQYFYVEFIKDPESKGSDFRRDFTGTRLTKGDFVLLTPQQYKPLTIQTFYGTINKILTNSMIVQFSKISLNEIKNYPIDEIFRLDPMVSDNMIDNQKRALDKFLRKPYLVGYENLTKIRNLMINLDTTTPISNIKSEKSYTQSEIDNLMMELRRKNYNKKQIDAICKACQCEDLFLLQGPPGTGKTNTLAEIVYQLNKKSLENKKNHNVDSKIIKSLPDKGNKNLTQEFEPVQEEFELEIDNKIIKKNILISAFTNRAIDTMIDKIKEKYPKLDIVRVGIESSVSSNIQSLLLQNRIKKKIQLEDNSQIEVNSPELAREILENADIIAATCLGSGSTLLSNFVFDYVILDETGQVIEPVALIPLLKGEKGILIGDDHQLPPISQNVEFRLDYEDFFENKSYIRNYDSKANLPGFEKGSSAESLPLIEKISILKDELKYLKLEAEDNLSISIFQRFSRIFKNTDRFIDLNKQYRMTKIISDFVSDNFYAGKLSPGIITDKNIDIGSKTLLDFFETENFPFYSELNKYRTQYSKDDFKFINKIFSYKLPIIFVDSMEIEAFDSKTDSNFDELSSKYNQKEAEIISKIVTLYLRTIFNYFISSGIIDNHLTLIHFIRNIGIISPYRAQVRLIRSIIYDEFNQTSEIQELIERYLIIDTVDKFQGNEAEIILISLTDSNNTLSLGNLHSEIRRLNVSLSRAKTKLVVIGNSTMFYEPKQTKKSKNTSIIDFMAQKSISPKNRGRNIENILINLINYCLNLGSYIKLKKNILQ